VRPQTAAPYSGYSPQKNASQSNLNQLNAQTAYGNSAPFTPSKVGKAGPRDQLSGSRGTAQKIAPTNSGMGSYYNTA